MDQSDHRSPVDRPSTNRGSDLPRAAPQQERKSTDLFPQGFDVIYRELEHLVHIRRTNSVPVTMWDLGPIDDRIDEIQAELLARREERLAFDEAQGRDADPALLPTSVLESVDDKVWCNLELWR